MSDDLSIRDYEHWYDNGEGSERCIREARKSAHDFWKDKSTTVAFSGPKKSSQWIVRKSENPQWDFEIVDGNGVVIAGFDSNEESRFSALIKKHNLLCS